MSNNRPYTIQGDAVDADNIDIRDILATETPISDGIVDMSDIRPKGRPLKPQLDEIADKILGKTK